MSFFALMTALEYHNQVLLKPVVFMFSCLILEKLELQWSNIYYLYTIYIFDSCPRNSAVFSCSFFHKFYILGFSKT